MARRGADGGYAWETQFERSWDQIQEDPRTGRLHARVGRAGPDVGGSSSRGDIWGGDDVLDAHGNNIGSAGRKVRRGMLRAVVIALDLSRSASMQDMRPSRGDVIASAAEQFVREFYDQNPISTIGVVSTRASVAHCISPLGASPSAHIQSIRDAVSAGTFGDPSVLNSLHAALRLLTAAPSHASKELVLLYASLSTCDPSDVFAAIDACAAAHVRASVVSAAGAEVHVLAQLASRTLGTHVVALSESHLHASLLRHLQPPPILLTVSSSSSTAPATLVRMGFPVLRQAKKPRVTVDTATASSSGYECPRCNAWLRDIPAQCALCGLQLLTAPHLARSYHHLFPIAPFTAAAAVSAVDGDGGGNGDGVKKQASSCFGCLRWFVDVDDIGVGIGGGGGGRRCARCGEMFCAECDVFIHDALHSCPGCENCGVLLYE